MHGGPSVWLAPVLERLGFADAPTVDEDGLTAVYRAWGRRISFDNVRKLIALRGGEPGPLPGTDADDFFDAWLRHGTGGTCWPSANALHELLRALGFDSRRVVASMYDTGRPSHGTTIVTFDGREFCVDSSVLTDRPVPLDPGGPTAVDHPPVHTTAEPVAEGWLFDFPWAQGDERIACRTLSPDRVGFEVFAERYEASRAAGAFNERLFAHTNRDATTLTLVGAKRFRRTVDGVDAHELDDEQLREALIGELSFSEEIVGCLLEP